MISMTPLNPISIVEGNAEEILRAVDAAKGSGAGFIVLCMASENAAKGYARVLRDVVEILPAALEKAQRSRIERLIEALVQGPVTVNDLKRRSRS